MVKDVVKSECRMIDMWSCFQAVDAPEICSTDSEKTVESRAETLQLPHVVKLVARDDKNVVRKISNADQRTASSSFCS
jgi:hypothetical protein